MTLTISIILKDQGICHLTEYGLNTKTKTLFFLFVLILTFDVVETKIETDETQAGYERLITEAVNKIGAINVKGAYGDGDRLN